MDVKSEVKELEDLIREMDERFPIYCANCKRKVSHIDAVPFYVENKICALTYAKTIGRTVVFLCPQCAKKYKVIEVYMGDPIIVPKGDLVENN